MPAATERLRALQAEASRSHWGRLLLWLLVGLLLLSPLLVGVFPIFPAAAVLGLLLVFALYAFSPYAQSVRSKQAALVILATAFAVTCADLLAREVVYSLWDARPKELAAHRWPPLPQVYRFQPDIKFTGLTYGDLAAISGRNSWREYRPITFVTDHYGFRNDPSVPESGPLDLIILGDSFCVGDSTSQEHTWSSLLIKDYGLKVYNLCMDGAGPWQEYVNLLVEGDRLKTRDRTVVLWVIFTGNDLDDPYWPAFDKAQLPWLSPLGYRLYQMKEFRYRSPLRRMLFAEQGATPVERVVEKTLPGGRRVLFSEAYAQAKDRTADEIKRHPNYEPLKATFSAMKRLAAERRLTVAVVSIPDKEEVYAWLLDGTAPWTTHSTPSAFALTLKELCEQNGLPFLDLKPALVAASKRVFAESGELLWWADDTHWNPSGQNIAAATIYNELLRPTGDGLNKSAR
jgi:SGNH hydrolase-like domain, acetyltransferase AlgX